MDGSSRGLGGRAWKVEDSAGLVQADEQAAVDGKAPDIVVVAAGQADAARSLLEAGIEVPDLREGETLGALWRAAFGDRPLPYAYDFRMRPDLSD